MSRYERLLSVYFDEAMPDVPWVGQTLLAGAPLYEPAVRSLGCIEDWRGGFVQLEPGDRDETLLVPFHRVTEMRGTTGPDMRPSAAPRVETVGAPGCGPLPLYGVRFRTDVLRVLPHVLVAGTLLTASQVRSLRLTRSLYSVVVIVPLGIEKEIMVALDDVLTLVLSAAEGEAPLSDEATG